MIIHADAWLTFHQGDVREVLAELADASVHCVVTSPPYWGLRNYGVDGQLGLEPTPETYIESMVAVFREVRRVLRDDGTLWLNMGDSYAASGMGGNPAESAYRKQATNVGSLIKGHAAPPSLKPKDLVGMPWRLALALQADGWYLRSDIVWAKPNPMPESVTDRPTRSHEYVFLLTKRARYHFDAEAVREPATTVREELNRFASRPEVGFPGHQPDRRRNGKRVKVPGGWDIAPGGHATIHREGRTVATYRELGPKLADAPDEVRAAASARMGRGAGWREDKQRAQAAARPDGGRHIGGLNDRTGPGSPSALRPGRNLRDVWTIASEPYPGAHFATFPQRLVEPCILAGTSQRGVCPECGAPWRREVRTSGGTTGQGWHDHAADLEEGAGQGETGRRPVDGWKSGTCRRETTGWRPTCEHYPRTSEWPALPPLEPGEDLDDYEVRVAHVHALRSELLDLWRPLLSVPATVLDPFAGSGTVAVVAERLQRRTVLVELNPEYVGQILERIAEGRRDGSGAPADLPLEAPAGSLWG